MKTLLAAVIPDRSSELFSTRGGPERFPDSLSTPLSNSSLTHAVPTKLPFGRRATDFVECPKCGKRSIVARAQNTFDCLNCNFHRELPPVSRSGNRQVTRQFAHSTHPQARRLNPLASPGQYRSPLELTELEHESESSQPLLFAAIAVIFGILLL